MEQAAALPMAMGTACRALMTQGKLKPGNTVLIQGIGGGVALACLQIAVKMGARVTVTSGSMEKLTKALELGAAAGIHYKEENIVERVKQLTNGAGVDIAVASTGDVVPTSVEVVNRAVELSNLHMSEKQLTILILTKSCLSRSLLLELPCIPMMSLLM